MPKYETLSMKLTDDLTLAEIDEQANKFDMNRSQFVVYALRLVAKFDSDLLNYVKEYSKHLNIEEWIVIQNFVLERLAKDKAEIQVWGSKNETLDEFVQVKDENGMRALTGKELLNLLELKFIESEEKKKLNLLLEKESLGLKLDESEKKFLIKNRAGKTWYESDEFKKLNETKLKASDFVSRAKKDGLIDKNIKIDYKLLLFVERLLNTNLGEDEIIIEISAYCSGNTKVKAFWGVNNG